LKKQAPVFICSHIGLFVMTLYKCLPWCAITISSLQTFFSASLVMEAAGVILRQCGFEGGHVLLRCSKSSIHYGICHRE